MSTVATEPSQDKLRYPIGKFRFPDEVSQDDRTSWIAAIEILPTELRNVVEDLTDPQLDTAYREGGWTVRQLVHHLADSHINSYTRFRLALTEDRPVIKTYEETAWATLPDARTAAPELSLRLLGALHARWVLLLRSLKDEDWKRTFRHPDLGEIPLARTLGLYAWHGRHHTAHIANLRERMCW
jgi:uncharacterized damage-inducible protein DinB